MEIVYRPLSAIKPNPKNPRKGTDEGIKNLAESIKNNPRFFEARPVLLSDRTGELVIIGGERRSEAAALLRMKEVPTILMSGLTEEQEDEIMVRDNTHTGIWDEIKLKEIASQWGGDKVAKWDAPKIHNIDISSLFNQEKPQPAKKYSEITIVVPVDIDVEEVKRIVAEALDGYNVTFK